MLYRKTTDEERSITLEKKDATAFQAEVLSILKCVQLYLARGFANEHIFVRTDNQAAIKTTYSHKFSFSLVWDCPPVLTRTLHQEPGGI